MHKQTFTTISDNFLCVVLTSRHQIAGIITGIEIFLLIAIYVIFTFSDRVPVSGLIAMGLLWMVRRWATGRLKTMTPMDVPILTILIMVPVSLYVSVDRSLSQPKFYGLILGFAVFYVIVNATHTICGLRFAAVFLIIVSVVVVMMALVGTDWPHAQTKPFPELQLYDYLPELIQEIPRSRKGGFSPNGIGGTLTFLIPVLLSLLWSDRPSLGIWKASDNRLLRVWQAGYRPILALSLLLTTFTLALTQSRGSFIGIAVGLLALAAWHDRRALWAIPIIALALFAVFKSGRGWQLTQFVLRVDADSRTVQRRVEIWQRAIYMIRDFPHTGVGMGAFNTALSMDSLTRDSDDWEYVERVVAPTKPFQAIDIYLRYDDQSGTAWFDDLTFEETTQIALNASFEADSDGNSIPDHWKGIRLTSQDGQDDFYVKGGNYSFKITGASGVKKGLRQRISLPGDASQQFSLSGWSRVDHPDPDGGYHGLMAVVRYSDGTRDGFRVPFFISRLPTQVTHAHNELLQVAVDLGIPGLVGYVALLTTFALTAWRAYHVLNDRWLRALIVGLACGMLAHQVFGLTDAFLLGTKPGVVMWVFMGLIAALYAHRDSIVVQLSGNEGAEAEREGGNGLRSVGGSGGASTGRRLSRLGSFLLPFGCWVLFSLLAIAFVGDWPYLGLAIALTGGVILGFVCMRRFESKPQEEPNGTNGPGSAI
jgi:O-antigen ligase